ncbi:MAG: nucleotidyltransferase domain-containing protein [Chlamydiota bacterium]
MRFGLKQGDIEAIVDIIEEYPQIKKARMFGSRALETHKPGSDVDIALVGDDLDRLIGTVSARLNEESPLPYYFDVVDYCTLTNQNFINHIDRAGQQFYP